MALAILALSVITGQGQTLLTAAHPAWLGTTSASVKEGYDSNLYGVSATPAGHPNVANVSSTYTTLDATLTVDFLAPAGPRHGHFLSLLTLAYAADYTAYQAVAREDNLRNTFTLTLRGKEGPWSAAIDNQFLFVDGGKDDPFYSTYNVLGYAPTRERRKQAQERNTSFLRYDWTHAFVRVAANATYYNLMIDEHNPVGAYKGYINWVNRDDQNGGVDLGYKLAPDFALTAGWRLGSQTQGRPYYSTVDNDNTYNRALLGLEGKLFHRLQLSVVAGPDFRRYTDVESPGLTGSRHTWLYLQGQAALTLSAHDTLAVSTKVWHFVSSPGLTSFQDSASSLTYKHSFTKALEGSVAATEMESRYDAPTVRSDYDRSYPVSLTYAATRCFTLVAEFNDVTGHSLLSSTVTPGRGFNDHLVSLTARLSL